MLRSTPTATMSVARVRHRAERADRLRKRGRRSAVQESVGLRVALDRHRRDARCQRLRETIFMPSRAISVSSAKVSGRPVFVGGHKDRLAPVSESAKDTLLLVDGLSMAFRAFFGLPVENFATSDGCADERRLRLHGDARDPHARAQAHARRRGVRPPRRHVPHRASCRRTRARETPRRPTSSRRFRSCARCSPPLAWPRSTSPTSRRTTCLPRTRGLGREAGLHGACRFRRPRHDSARQ